MEDALKKIEEATSNEAKSVPSSPLEAKSVMDMLSQMQTKVLTEGTNSAGGFLVPDQLSSAIIDVVRNQSAVLKLADVVTINSDRFRIPKLLTSTTAGWQATETTVKAESDATFGELDLSPKTVYTLVRMSIALAEDSNPDAVAVVRKDMASQVLAAMDRGMLEGDGLNGTLTGLANTAGVTTTAAGATFDLDDIATAISSVEANGFAPNGIILNARDKARLRTLKDSTGGYIYQSPTAAGEQGSVWGIPIVVSANMTTTDLSRKIYVGQWDQAIVAMRKNLTFDISKDRYFEFNQLGLRLEARVGFGIKNAGAFSVISGL